MQPESFDDWPLHDAVLRELRIEWKEAVCTLHVHVFTDPNERAKPHLIRFSGITSVTIPHEAPWGGSIFINGQRIASDGAYLIEVQSGDVIVIRARSAELVPVPT